MPIFHVQRQCWQRWPRVLIVERVNDDDSKEERRYIPEGGTRDEWNDRLRRYIRDYSKAAEKLNARILEESEVPGLKAEIDGLRWAVEERDQLIRDMRSVIEVFCDSSECDSCPALGEGVPCRFGEVDGRMKTLGIGN